jgi:hypothetical protein
MHGPIDANNCESKNPVSPANTLGIRASYMIYSVEADAGAYYDFSEY